MRLKYAMYAVCGAFATVIVLAILLPALASPRSGRRETCANNLKQLGLTCYMFAEEMPNGLFPPLDTRYSNFIFDPDSRTEMTPVKNGFLQDPTWLHCVLTQREHLEAQMNWWESTPPENATHHAEDDYYADDCFWYTGYELPDEETALAFLEIYRNTPDPTTLPDIIQLDQPLSNGRQTIPRLSLDSLTRMETEGVKLPTLIERPRDHGGVLGGNVLYADGHVEYVEYPGKYPMTEAVISALDSFDEPRESGTP